MATSNTPQHNTLTIPNSENPNSLRVMTYNCWGLKYISHHRRARLSEIGRAISMLSPPPHIVGLQECWVQEDFNSIRSQTSNVLPHAKFYFSGCFGGGLAILSAFPIEESSMYRYPLNGRPTAIHQGDWYVGKGVACARIRLPPHPLPTEDEEIQIPRRTRRKGEVVEVFCTHLYAPNDTYLCYRTAQAWEIAKLMRHATERGHLVLGLGDFNMLPLSLAHRIITSQGGVVDVWRDLHPDSSLGPATYPAEKQRGKPVPTAKYNLDVNGAASDNVLNTWRWSKKAQRAQYGAKKTPTIDIPDDTPDPNAKRLDYIFVGHGRYQDDDDAEYEDNDTSTQHPHRHPKRKSQWYPTSAHIGMTTLHPTLHCSLSDHFSIHATLTLLSSPPSITSPSASHSPTPDEILPLFPSHPHLINRERHLRLLHFLLQTVLVTPACLVGVWFSPHAYVSFILMLVSTLGFAAGVIYGLVEWLFCGIEMRALKEVVWEVGCALGSEGGGGRGVDEKRVRG